MTALNTLTVINAAEKAGLFAAMREIKILAPEVAATMIESCIQHFSSVIAMVGNGKDEKTIGVEFGCGEIDSFGLFTMVANQAFEDLQVYVNRRDPAPTGSYAEFVIAGDRLLNAFTGRYEEVKTTFRRGNEIVIKTADGSHFILPFGSKVSLKC